MYYKTSLKQFNEVCIRLNRRESFRKSFVRYNRFATITFIVLISMYSIYLYKMNDSIAFNYGRAWWVAIVLLVIGWMGELIIVHNNTKLYRTYLVVRDEYTDELYKKCKESKIEQVNPFLENNSTIRNPLFLKLFEYAFYDYAREIQEEYLKCVNIFILTIKNSDGLVELLNTNEIPKMIGKKIAHQYQHEHLGSFSLIDNDEIGEDCIVCYTKN